MKYSLLYQFNDDEYVLELNDKKIREFLSSIDDAAICACAEYVFSKLTEAERSEIITDILNDDEPERYLTKEQEGTNVKYSVNWQANLDADRDYVYEFIEDDLNYFNDDMYDYFYREAAEGYDDAEYYRRKGPYGYVGMSPRDFY